MIEGKHLELKPKKQKKINNKSVKKKIVIAYAASPSNSQIILTNKSRLRKQSRSFAISYRTKYKQNFQSYKVRRKSKAVEGLSEKKKKFKNSIRPKTCIENKNISKAYNLFDSESGKLEVKNKIRPHSSIISNRFLLMKKFEKALNKKKNSIEDDKLSLAKSWGSGFSNNYIKVCNKEDDFPHLVQGHNNRRVYRSNYSLLGLKRWREQNKFLRKIINK